MKRPRFSGAFLLYGFPDRLSDYEIVRNYEEINLSGLVTVGFAVLGSHIGALHIQVDLASL